jgi:hypothetical protein
MSMVFYWGALTATTGHFLYPGSYENTVSTAGENLTRIIVPRPGTLKNFFILGGGALTLTVRLAGSNTAITASLGGGGAAQDLTHSVVVTAANVATGTHYLTIGVTGTAGVDARCSLEFV